MKPSTAIFAGAGLVLAAGAFTFGRQQATSVGDWTRQWPTKAREAALAMEKKYGAPAERTTTMLVWHRSGPWKRTIVYNYEVQHAFPKPHADVMEQFIDYRSPIDKIDDVIGYDGSVVIQRTNGEISARCDKEEMNFLAINLANDVATGGRSVEDARREYARVAMAVMDGQREPITQRLLFDVARGNTRDPDQPATETSSRQ